MTPEQQENLRRAMEEAALLPTENPMRREIEACIVEAGNWAEEEWLEMLQSDELLRLDLQRIAIPAGLEEKLMAIPDEVPISRSSRRIWIYPVTAAAMLLLTLGILQLRQNRSTELLNTVAMLAISNHENIDYVSIHSDKNIEVEQHLSKKAGFEVKMPALNQRLQLKGGRNCGLGTHGVVFSRWVKDDKKYSLYQFCSKDFGLPEEILKRVVIPKCPSVSNKQCCVLIWTEGSCAYALVADQPEHLEEIQDIL